MNDGTPQNDRRNFLKIAGALAATAATGCSLETHVPDAVSSPANDRASGFDRSVLDAARRGGAADGARSEGSRRGDRAIHRVGRRLRAGRRGDAWLRLLRHPVPAAGSIADVARAACGARPSGAQSRDRNHSRSCLLRRAANSSRSQRRVTAENASPLHSTQRTSLSRYWRTGRPRPDAWDLAYGAKITPDTCRTLGDANTKPLPIIGLRA